MLNLLQAYYQRNPKAAEKEAPKRQAKQVQKKAQPKPPALKAKNEKPTRLKK